jgi:hypothetical protein
MNTPHSFFLAIYTEQMYSTVVVQHNSTSHLTQDIDTQSTCAAYGLLSEVDAVTHRVYCTHDRTSYLSTKRRYQVIETLPLLASRNLVCEDSVHLEPASASFSKVWVRPFLHRIDG